jgi:SAM-dependent methyltransferase
MSSPRTSSHIRRSRHPVAGRRTGPESGATVPGRHRFLEWDEYRVEREWRRYEGTPLRDLYRELRERFLARHRADVPGRSLEIGPGPGRFTPFIGRPEDPIVLLELSRAMLEWVRENPTKEDLPNLALVQGDAVSPPFRAGKFHRVVMLGNVLGFAERDGPELMARTSALVAPGGKLLLEFVSGAGERAHYLHRLPVGAVARLFAAPVRAIQPRVEREGFDPVRPRDEGNRRFLRISPSALHATLEATGFDVIETLAVAPSLGNDPSRLGRIRADPTAWTHLLELEEAIGRAPARQVHAAAVLLAAERRAR